MKLAILLLALPLVRAASEVRTWEPAPHALGAEPVYRLCLGGHDLCDIGLQFDSTHRIGEFRVDYATLAGRAYEPALTGQALQYWDGEAWRDIAAGLTIDYRDQGLFAPVEGSGVSHWVYRFTPVETRRVRVLFTQPRNPEAWHRLYAVRHIEAVPGPTAVTHPGTRILGSMPPRPAWLEPGADLTTAGTGAHMSPGRVAEVHWPRPLMISRAEWKPAMDAAVEWWDGALWRAVESTGALAPGRATFLPIATTGLRVRSSGPDIVKIAASLDSGGPLYATEVRHSRFDLLGERFRRAVPADLNAMRGLLLPLDFAQTAIGRPGDLEETHVAWNGTFFTVEDTSAGNWNHGAASRQPSPERFDRWFAFAAGTDTSLFGSDWAATRTSYLDGWLPATVTTCRRDGIAYRQTLFVTAPGDPVYGTVAEVTVTNISAVPARASLTMVMGRRRNDHTTGNDLTPLAFAPEKTGYRWHENLRAVVSAAGEPVLYAESPGAWAGTEYENQLRYTVPLTPRESRKLRFLAPAAPGSVGDYDWTGAPGRFRRFWRETLDRGMQLDLPEPAFNDAYRNLLAQALIITLDGDSQVKYGSYSYESYFGIEEGWPAIALAQYGHAETARKILAIMLSPALMDKSNYHHQYRNGLEPWYAVTAYRLSHDRAWLQKIAPALEAAAEWTIRAIHANRDPRYGGILPKHAYGGDIHAPAYSFYSNATCWRGLRDTALAFRALGRTELAARYEREAAEYRRRLLSLADELADRKSEPVFLPVSFDVGSGADYRATEPPYDFLAATDPPGYTWKYLGNYWNLFAPMLLEVKLFDVLDPRSHWVPGFMEARGGISAGLVRFTRGLDQIYGKGYYESLLEHGRRERFLTSLYGIFAHGMSPNLNSFPEVAGMFPLRFDNAAMWEEHQRNLWTWGFQGWENSEGQPLSAGPGMALQILRMALVRETVETGSQDELRLFDGVPSGWFAAGKKIAVRRAPTFFGEISVETDATAGGVSVRVDTAPGFQARRIVLRIDRPFRDVMVNGRPWADFAGSEVRLPGAGRFLVVMRRRAPISRQ